MSNASSAIGQGVPSTVAAGRRRRYAADRRLRYYGLGAIVLAVALLGVLFGSLISKGYTAFVQTMLKLEVNLDAAEVDLQNPEATNWRSLARAPLVALIPDLSRVDQRDMLEILSSGAPNVLREMVMANPDWIGRNVELYLPVSDPFDQLNKGAISRAVAEDRRRVSDKQIAWFDELEEKGLISTQFNTGLFLNADSRFPELAGVAGAVAGSFYALLVCFLISFPAGIAAAVYLEKFAPSTRWTHFIEVNINNLAAVPSIVFGLLALAVFLGWFGLPRSAPLVGGMTLALMTLPTIIIVTRAALRSVPPSISEAALGIGASKHETILHHVLPLALPSILTGTIIGLAQALGETAPLLLIGMNAFIPSPPGGIADPSTALPTQIFIWADSPERGFVSRTSAAILILLAFLVTMNAVAVFLRQKYQKVW